jgi:hypothetical protein
MVGQGRLMPLRAVMTGSAAKQLAGGVAILAGWASAIVAPKATS